MKPRYGVWLITIGTIISFFVLRYEEYFVSKFYVSHVRVQEVTDKTVKLKHPDDEVVICVVSCGTDRLDETLTMLKSALVFSKRPLRFIVISDYKLIPAFHEKLTEWKQIVNRTFEFTVRPISFPIDKDAKEWRMLFKPCAAQRLFLPVSFKISTFSATYVYFLLLCISFFYYRRC